MSARYNIKEEVGERFYRLPKVFFTSPKYKDMSNNAKITFAILQDRMDLSIKNQWVDAAGDIYFVYGNEELGDILNMGKTTVIKTKKELRDARLLEEVRIGQNKRNRMYLLKPEASEEDIRKIRNEGENVEAVGKFKKRTSGGSESELPEVQNVNSKLYLFSDTDRNETDKNINPSPETADLPQVILQVLESRLDRLMKDNITVDSIERHYKAHTGVLNEYQYADCLNYVLSRTEGRIRDIHARMSSAVESKAKWLSSLAANKTNHGRVERAPEWMSGQETKSSDTPRVDLEAEKEKLLQELNARKQNFEQKNNETAEK